MTKINIVFLAGAAVLLSLCAGCHHAESDNFASMNRADQQKALKGDPEKAKEYIAKMQAAGKAGNPPAAQGQ